MVSENIFKEVELGRIVGLFSEPSFPGLRVFPLGLELNKEAKKFQLIYHFSFPRGDSVNDGINPRVVLFLRIFGCDSVLGQKIQTGLY